MNELISIDVKLYLEVLGSDLHGGETVCVIMTFGNQKDVSVFTDERIRLIRQDVAKTHGVPIESVRQMSKAESAERFGEDE